MSSAALASWLIFSVQPQRAISLPAFSDSVMAALSVFAILTKPKSCIFPYPQRELAFAVLLVALAAGYFVPLHLLGTLNLLFTHPTITSAVVIVASLVGICVSALLLRRSVFEGPEGYPSREVQTSAAVKLVVALTVIPYAAFFLDTLWSFPNGYDSIAYHIDVALKWLQHGTMRVNPAWGWQYSLPSNAELPALAMLSIGMPKAVAVGNLFAALLLVTSVYLIAWRITRDNKPAVLAAIVAITIPMVIYQTFQLYVDLFGTAFIIAAIALFIWRDASPPLSIFLSGYAVGMAVGSKPVFWVYGAMFVTATLLTILRAKKSRLKCAVLLAAGILLSSGLWFLRSALATGNPLYPMRVSIGRFEIFRGYARTDITSVDYGIRSFRSVLTQPWSETANDNGLPVGADRGTGPLFAAIVLPGLLFLLVRSIRRQASTLEQCLLLATAVGFVLWAAALLRVPRFALPIMALSCALAAPMLQALLLQTRRLVIVLYLTGVVLNSLYCLAEPAQRAIYRIQRRDFSRATYYGYPPIIDQLPPGSRIIDHTEAHRSSFLLAGAGLTNYVLPSGDAGTADYIVRDGPSDTDDAAILSNGAKLIYDATPPSLYPKTARPWRIYRIH